MFYNLNRKLNESLLVILAIVICLSTGCARNSLVVNERSDSVSQLTVIGPKVMRPGADIPTFEIKTQNLDYGFGQALSPLTGKPLPMVIAGGMAHLAVEDKLAQSNQTAVVTRAVTLLPESRPWIRAVLPSDEEGTEWPEMLQLLMRSQAEPVYLCALGEIAEPGTYDFHPALIQLVVISQEKSISDPLKLFFGKREVAPDGTPLATGFYGKVDSLTGLNLSTPSDFEFAITDVKPFHMDQKVRNLQILAFELAVVKQR